MTDPMSVCPFCEHDAHDNKVCTGIEECEDCSCAGDKAIHFCACSYPDPGNFTTIERAG